MAIVRFSSHLSRHVSCPDEPADGATVRAVLDAYFARHPAVRSYVLDEQGALRRHVVVFIGDRQMTDRAHLAEPVGSGEELWIMQALSGG